MHLPALAGALAVLAGALATFSMVAVYGTLADTLPLYLEDVQLT